MLYAAIMRHLLHCRRRSPADAADFMPRAILFCHFDFIIYFLFITLYLLMLYTLDASLFQMPPLIFIFAITMIAAAEILPPHC